MRKHNWNRSGFARERNSHRGRPGDDDLGSERNQLFRERPHPINVAGRPAVLDFHIASVAPAQVLQPLPKRHDLVLRDRIACSQAHQHADLTHALGLLRARRERPRRRRAAKQRDELAPVAVGIRVTSHPPHRSVRAAFPHTVPTSGIHGNYVLPYASQHL